MGSLQIPSGARTRVIDLPTLVAPRITVFQGAERLPATDVIESLLCSNQMQIVALGGVDSSHAIAFLKDFYRNEPRIHVASSIHWNEVDANCRLLIRIDKPHLAKHFLSIAPWDRDDVIQYLLETQPDQCNSILNRIAPEHFAWVRGGFSIWKCIIGEMIESPHEKDFLRILKSILGSRLPAIVPSFGYESMNWFADQLMVAGSWEKLKLLSDDPVYSMLLDIAPLRLRIEADRVVDLVERCNKKILLTQHPSQRIIEVSKRLRGNKLAIDFLKSCVFERYASTAASILTQLDCTWKPKSVSDLPLQNAYLDGADWVGVCLEEAKLGSARLSSVCLDNSILTGSVLHFAKCNGSSFAGAKMRGVKAHRASFVDANFSRADLQATYWRDCGFYDADFSETRLDGSSFLHCDLRDADFRASIANATDFRGCKMLGVSFLNAQLVGAKFSNLDLRETSWFLSLLSKANLKGAILESLTMNHCSLDDADLSQAYLSNSCMRESNLAGCNLSDSRLGSIDWEHCNLQGADLRGVTFHYGSTRCGIVDSPYPSHGTRTGFYTDDQEDLYFKSPELVRKASLFGCDLRGAKLDGVDLYLVDLREANLDPVQRQAAATAGAILE